MSERPPQDVAPIRRKRPLSVWVLTIADSLFAGVFLLAASFRLCSRPVFRGFEFSTGQVALWGLLGLGICLSAHMAWYGSRTARNLLLALMTIYLALGIVQNANYLAWAADGAPGGFIRQQIMEAVRAILWLAANYWFLLGRRAREFYR